MEEVSCRLTTPCVVVLFVAMILGMPGLLWSWSWFSLVRPLKLPPGPKRLPLIGNLHQVSVDYQERTFARWAKDYGELSQARRSTGCLPTVISDAPRRSHIRQVLHSGSSHYQLAEDSKGSA